jgi:hypothetical protein
VRAAASWAWRTPWLLLAAASLACGTLPPGSGPATAPEGEIPDKPVVTFDPPSRPAATDAPDATNERVNRDASGRDQNETTVAVNPLDPLNIVGGANDAREGSWAAGYYYSLDGGETFADGVMPFRKYPNQGDPTVAFCGDGTAVFGYLDYSGAYQPHRLVVARSTDGGASWLGPGVVSEAQSFPFADKPYIACAPEGGIYANRAYISWTHFGFAGGPIRVAWSADRGQTWQGARNVSASGGVQGSVPVAGRDGEVWVFWLGDGIEFARSTNGGGTWSGASTAAAVDAIGDVNYRRNSFPTAGIDRSGGARDGTVYVAWSDDRLGDPDILLSRSADQGQTWSEPLRVNDDPVGNGSQQFFPWLAVDERGDVHLMWHDSRGDPYDQLLHIYVATSRDGGESFDRNLRVTDVASDGGLTGFLGDYAALAAGHGKIFPLWCDLRAGTGEEDAYLEVEPAFDYDIVSGVRFREDGETLEFDEQSPRLGTGLRYDVAVGNVADLAATAPWTAASCAAEDLPGSPAQITDRPANGEALYVIVRAQGPRGTGSFGSGTAHPDPRDGYDDEPACD